MFMQSVASSIKSNSLKAITFWHSSILCQRLTMFLNFTRLCVCLFDCKTWVNDYFRSNVWSIYRFLSNRPDCMDYAASEMLLQSVKCVFSTFWRTLDRTHTAVRIQSLTRTSHNNTNVTYKRFLTFNETIHYGRMTKWALHCFWLKCRLVAHCRSCKWWMKLMVLVIRMLKKLLRR